MGETGCLKDGKFQNLEVKNTTILNTGDVTMTGGLNLQEKFTSTGVASSDNGRLIINTPVIRFGPPTATVAGDIINFPAIKQPANTVLANVGFYVLETVGNMSANSNTGMAVGTQALTAATLAGGTGIDIVDLDPDSLENTNDTASGLTQGNCQTVGVGNVGMTLVGASATACAFVNSESRITAVERDVHISLVSSAHGAATDLVGGNPGGNFAVVPGALAPFIVYKSFNTFPAVGDNAEKRLFIAALSNT